MNILETDRILLRTLAPGDLDALRPILQDAKTMYAYEHAFSDAEVRDWLARQRLRYRTDGFGLWAVIRKSDGLLIGQCGITLQAVGNRYVPEIGYLFRRDCWHQGYATEAARACRRYAFETLGLSEVWSIVRDTNLPSRRVAERNGMRLAGTLTKHYYGMEMPHTLYKKENPRSKSTRET